MQGKPRGGGRAMRNDHSECCWPQISRHSPLSSGFFMAFWIMDKVMGKYCKRDFAPLAFFTHSRGWTKSVAPSRAPKHYEIMDSPFVIFLLSQAKHFRLNTSDLLRIKKGAHRGGGGLLNLLMGGKKRGEKCKSNYWWTHVCELAQKIIKIISSRPPSVPLTEHRLTEGIVRRHLFCPRLRSSDECIRVHYADEIKCTKFIHSALARSLTSFFFAATDLVGSVGMRSSLAFFHGYKFMHWNPFLRWQHILLSGI